MPVNFNFSGKFLPKDGTTVDLEVNFIQFKDGNCYVVYAPALEMYGYGYTVAEAKKSFVTCTEEFLDYTISKNTLRTELRRLGWKIRGRKSKRSYRLPDFSELLVKNQKLIDIMNEREVRTYKADIPMALPA